MENPFNKLYKLMGEATNIPVNLYIAEVLTPLPNLTIKINDITLDKDDFMIDKYLIDRHLVKNEDHDKLLPGDKLVTISIENKFYVLSKVINI